MIVGTVNLWETVDVLRQEGVGVRGMRFDREARTTMAFIAMPDENTQEFVFYRNPGADTRLYPDELDYWLLQETRALHFGSLSLTHEPSRSATMEAVQIAREAGALISFDVNYRPTLWSGPDEARDQIMTMIPHVHLLKVNEVELALLEQGPDLCVVTLGPEGSYFQIAEGDEHVPAFKVRTVDSTGCGDAFVAGLPCQLALSANWREQLTSVRMREVLRYANAVGALTALAQGVIPALPTAVQVDQFLEQHT